MTTPATYRRSCVFPNMPQTLRSEKKHLIPTETCISLFSLRIKKNDSTVMQMPREKLIAN